MIIDILLIYFIINTALTILEMAQEHKFEYDIDLNYYVVFIFFGLPIIILRLLFLPFKEK